MNEAEHQIAFADRILLNKLDLVTEDEVDDVYDRIRSINSFATVIKTQKSQAPLDQILGLNSFSLDKMIELDPTFMDDDDEDDGHDHSAEGHVHDEHCGHHIHDEHCGHASHEHGHEHKEHEHGHDHADAGHVHDEHCGHHDEGEGHKAEGHKAEGHHDHDHGHSHKEEGHGHDHGAHEHKEHDHEHGKLYQYTVHTIPTYLPTLFSAYNTYVLIHITLPYCTIYVRIL